VAAPVANPQQALSFRLKRAMRACLGDFVGPASLSAKSLDVKLTIFMHGVYHNQEHASFEPRHAPERDDGPTEVVRFRVNDLEEIMPGTP
jgi:hypothetical protein